ncbi:MAG: (2Fe-2S)-binding protein [Candidatus Thermoplasmatota archaeon]|jgi:carbon-monoxide dehydrogenase small subunit|nr:(2Fe-2S)-binding protein [Candidatus Thermoplasmatota archaeon]MCL5794336.1 (2Fe-2S)-binding protein [Candidatus Thermoplasmatota archaeon]
MGSSNVRITINGKIYEESIDQRMLLVDFIRERAGLTGTHVGCDTTNCGACTVHLDGRPVKSCTVLAVQADGKSVLTVEGLSRGEKLHPLQQAFLDKNGLQCGYCTSGMIMTALWLLKKNPGATREEIREALSGNICRCTGYSSIVDSIQQASGMSKDQAEEEEMVTRNPQAWR